MVAQLSEIAGQTFDYVVVGGGTAGLTVAGRLAEDPNVSVAVLEAGGANLDDPNILRLGTYGSTFLNPQYDWGFFTTPQKYSNGRKWMWNRGKGLGGSSALNFNGWLKPPAADIDAFEELGNPGWNWDSYQKFTCRTEKFTVPSEAQMSEFPHTFNKAFHGDNGPLQIAIPRPALKTNKLLFDTLDKKGVKLITDPYGGDINGCFITSSTIDRSQKWTRSYSATAFYLPNKDKPNFKVLIDASGSRVLFKDEEGEDLVACGVEFIHGGQTHTVNVRKDVILSAGTIKSPQILELSGIGQSAVLEKIGVPVKLDLPGVGENVQDHVFAGTCHRPKCVLNPDLGPYDSFDHILDPEFAKKQAWLQDIGERNNHELGITAFSYLPMTIADPEAAKSFHARVAKFVADAKSSGKLPPGLAEQYDIQLKALKDDGVPDMEFVSWPGFAKVVSNSIPDPKADHVTIMCFLQHPFSRGTIHAKSSDPLEYPDIDPHYYEVPFDLEIMVEQIKFIRRLAQTEPMKSGVVQEIDPGSDATSDEAIRDHLRNTSSTVFHAIGSLSMLPREKNGVVDPQLKASLSYRILYPHTHSDMPLPVADILKGGA
ncbi:hypothetical protein EUX98_g5668 [Antrodiella citrinella]|uniref:Glucose-methanol-choline oxidoreductase N-terminal domain-containing protein n=1 Tax=Antrodiella citrinella TaxID=2447956 RepID=A0A4S4MR68_9APHY|nr:hypothetical protein EUX98_g5668 [Antrodiella citrinella]